MCHFHQQWTIRGFPWFCRRDKGNKLHKSYFFSPLTQCLALCSQQPKLNVQLWRHQLALLLPVGEDITSPAQCYYTVWLLSPTSQGKSSIFISLARKWKVPSNSLSRHLTPCGLFFHLIWDFKPVPTVCCASLKSAVKPRVSIHSMAQSAAKADECQTANNWEIPQQPLNQKLQRLEFCLLRCLRNSVPLSAYTHSQVERQKTFKWGYFEKDIVC